MDGDQYGLPDLRQLTSADTHFPTISQPLEQQPFFQYWDLNLGTVVRPPSNHFGPIHHQIVPNNIYTQYGTPQVGFSDPSSSSALIDSGSAPPPPLGMEAVCVDRLMEGGSGGGGRWPRQETLTLLEIRSRLDFKFKEAKHKGPLWEEISRIMLEEYGYHRNGKKCREKFENLYKYYKKTKEGKAGRQDGKNYRFFHQLEAIYGEPSSSSNNTRVREAITYNWQDQNKLGGGIGFSISNSSNELEASSSENPEEYDLSAMAFALKHSMDKEDKMKHINDDDDPVDIDQANKRCRKLWWKEKVKGFVDSQMSKLMERQEAWVDNVLKKIERREEERAWREIEWRKQEMARLDHEHKIWAEQRARIKARDAALLENLRRFGGNQHEQLINVNLSLSKAQLLLQERGHYHTQLENSTEETRGILK
ncbi:hypothetical protein SAY86_027417 [Trapa natans]|uniref:Myb-like domain-containing protein n=1 Tax=Trapa natans TaxID=22666 RepID=A0AAN7KUE2_TRANT|nr:hypothetical protein SAY86_027417 [Trapa natans]